jgi:hypothetical protein
MLLTRTRKILNLGLELTFASPLLLNFVKYGNWSLHWSLHHHEIEVWKS